MKSLDPVYISKEKFLLAASYTRTEFISFRVSFIGQSQGCRTFRGTYTMLILYI